MSSFAARLATTSVPVRLMPDTSLGYRRIALAAALIALPATQVRAQSDAAREESVRAAETARGQALLKADTAALSRMVADEFIEISRLGTRRTKADNLRDIASGDLKLMTVRYDSLTVRLYGDVALLQG